MAFTFKHVEQRFRARPGHRVRPDKHNPALSAEGAFKEITHVVAAANALGCQVKQIAPTRRQLGLSPAVRSR